MWGDAETKTDRFHCAIHGSKDCHYFFFYLIPDRKMAYDLFVHLVKFNPLFLSPYKLLLPSSIGYVRFYTSFFNLQTWLWFSSYSALAKCHWVLGILDFYSNTLGTDSLPLNLVMVNCWMYSKPSNIGQVGEMWPAYVYFY